VTGNDRSAAFLKLADEELEAARRLIAPLPRQASYFLAQAAEKLVRALLAQSGMQMGPTHNLGQLVNALPADHELRPMLMPLDRLSPASTRYRYPNPGGRLAPPPNADVLQRDLSEIEALLAACKRYTQAKG
jgi:HEPN domain-containing protein